MARAERENPTELRVKSRVDVTILEICVHFVPSSSTFCQIMLSSPTIRAAARAARRNRYFIHPSLYCRTVRPHDDVQWSSTHCSSSQSSFFVNRREDPRAIR
jgi:hypothetical protein